MIYKLVVTGLLVAALAWCSPARAVVFPYSIFLSGPSESPANASPGTGTGIIVYDNVAHSLAMHIDFSGLTGTTSAAHIHAPTATSGLGSEAQASAAGMANVATTVPSFVGFPLGVTSGTFNSTLDLTLASSWNPAYVTSNGGTTAGAETALAAALAEGKAYFNIHTSTFGGGEIRGFTTLIPEPATIVLLALGIAAAAGLKRPRR
jgi:hypothetical protein